MNLSDMLTILGVYVDDIVDPTKATALFNAGQNKMAVDAKASFPQLSNLTPTGTLIFPEKYHEVPILYAAAMIKAQDSSIREKESFLGQFESMKADFTENYDAPAQYRDAQNVQQFVASVGQTAYVITKDTYDNPYGNLKVYINNILTIRFTIPTGSVYPFVTTTTTSTDPQSFTLLDVPNTGDFITAVWEIHHEYDQPPMSWWNW